MTGEHRNVGHTTNACGEVDGRLAFAVDGAALERVRRQRRIER
jgi:hypothetical protein